jgi:hypothetical protein
VAGNLGNWGVLREGEGAGEKGKVGRKREGGGRDGAKCGVRGVEGKLGVFWEMEGEGDGEESLVGAWRGEAGVGSASSSLLASRSNRLEKSSLRKLGATIPLPLPLRHIPFLSSVLVPLFPLLCFSLSSISLLQTFAGLSLPNSESQPGFDFLKRNSTGSLENFGRRGKRES